ncbi:hypothetical protein Tco_0873535 [Tanacetum coccineum]|uniref:Uncharacterized protein n=1 Tax=Tanacetum coccineum TaxID=301880 RepID=A0ABQ5BPQ8_9ASTR
MSRLANSLSSLTPTRTKVTPNSDDMNNHTSKFTVHSDVFTSASPNGSTNKNGGEHVGNIPINVFPTSYIIKVNDRMKNSLYGYYIDKRLVFPVVEWADKDKGGSPGVNDDSFIQVKKKKSGGNDADTKKFKSILVKPNTIYRPKVNQLTEEVSPKTAPSFGKKKVSTTAKSSKKTCKTNTLTSGNGTFSPSNSFEALNVDNPFTEELDSGNNDSIFGVQEEEQSVTLVVENINMIEQQLVGGSLCLWMMMVNH